MLQMFETFGLTLNLITLFQCSQKRPEKHKKEALQYMWECCFRVGHSHNNKQNRTTCSDISVKSNQKRASFHLVDATKLFTRSYKLNVKEKENHTIQCPRRKCILFYMRLFLNYCTCCMLVSQLFLSTVSQAMLSNCSAKLMEYFF